MKTTKPHIVLIFLAFICSVTAANVTVRSYDRILAIPMRIPIQPEQMQDIIKYTKDIYANIPTKRGCFCFTPNQFEKTIENSKKCVQDMMGTNDFGAALSKMGETLYLTNQELNERKVSEKKQENLRKSLEVFFTFWDNCNLLTIHKPTSTINVASEDDAASLSADLCIKKLTITQLIKAVGSILKAQGRIQQKIKDKNAKN